MIERHIKSNDYVTNSKSGKSSSYVDIMHINLYIAEIIFLQKDGEWASRERRGIQHLPVPAIK